MFIIDDIINAIGAHQAAQKQADAIRAAQQNQTDVYNQSRSDQSPYYNAGSQTLGDLMAQLSSGGFNTNVNPQNLANDPGYQFRMAEGQKALERSAAARGGLASGGFMKGLSRYSQGVASDEYNQAWNRQRTDNMDRFGRLFQMAGMGQHSADYLGGLGQNYANAQSQLYAAKGNAQAAGIMGVTNGISGAVRSGGNLAMLAAGDPMPMAGSMAGGVGGGSGGIPLQYGSAAGGVGYGAGGYGGGY